MYNPFLILLWVYHLKKRINRNLSGRQRQPVDSIGREECSNAAAPQTRDREERRRLHPDEK